MGCQDDMGNGLTHETLSLGEFLARGGEQRNVDPAVIIIVGAGGDQQAFQVSSPKDPGKSLVPVRNSAHGMLPLRDPHAQSSIQTRPQLVRPLESPVRARPERIQRLANSDESASSLEEHLLRLLGACRYLKHRAWLILPVAAVGLAVGAASFKYYPPVRAASCMVILHSAPRASPIESDNRQDQSESTQFFVGPERAFKSSENVLSALRHLGIPNASEPFAESIAKRMNLENIGNHAYVATLTPTFFGDRSDWHLGFLDAYVKSYVATEVEKTLKVFVAEVNFLRSQTEDAEERLNKNIQETVSFREANSNQILAQRTLEGNSAGELESKQLEVSGRIERLSGELTGIRSQLARGSALSQAKAQSTQVDQEALNNGNRKLVELRSQGFADGHPDVQRLLVEQRSLERVVHDHLDADVTSFERRSNIAFDSLQSQEDKSKAQLRAARAERGTIEASLRSRRTVSNQAPKIEARLQELLRTKEELERQHGLLFDRLKKAEVQLQLERVSTTSRYEIVIPAHLESQPGRKAFVLRMAAGLGLGLLLVAVVLGATKLRSMFARVALEMGQG